ncbi:MAG: hypothetical protein FWE06_07855 [Oscillospiraceae bacterium]|nr:hypothetical protein [Oscillospiraceae bacterium]
MSRNEDYSYAAKNIAGMKDWQCPTCGFKLVAGRSDCCPRCGEMPYVGGTSNSGNTNLGFALSLIGVPVAILIYWVSAFDIFIFNALIFIPCVAILWACAVGIFKCISAWRKGRRKNKKVFNFILYLAMFTFCAIALHRIISLGIV